MSTEEAQAQAILAKLQNLREQREQIISKITELDSQHSEHQLVIATLEPLPRDRRCFRLINDVLVERTNEEVLQAVLQNRDSLKKAMEEMAEMLKEKERELLEHVKKHNIRQTSDLGALNARANQQPAAEAPTSGGVLV